MKDLNGIIPAPKLLNYFCKWNAHGNSIWWTPCNISSVITTNHLLYPNRL